MESRKQFFRKEKGKRPVDKMSLKDTEEERFLVRQDPREKKMG